MKNEQFAGTWSRLRPELVQAYSVLLEQLSHSHSNQDLLDSYLGAKRLAAEAFQALLRANIPDRTTEWKTVRNTLEYEMMHAFAGTLPDWVTRIPYGSTTHHELFCLLCARLGEPVEADFLRVVTADAVHAERRVRELRELGLDIVPRKVAGTDTYTLRSLDVDKSFIRSIAANNVKGNRKISAEDRRLLLVTIGDR